MLLGVSLTHAPGGRSKVLGPHVRALRGWASRSTWEHGGPGEPDGGGLASRWASRARRVAAWRLATPRVSQESMSISCKPKVEHQ